MTPLQVSVLFGTARPVGCDINGTAHTRQMNWLVARGLVRKRLGYYVATRAGLRALLYQTEGWITVPEYERERWAKKLRRRY